MILRGVKQCLHGKDSPFRRGLAVSRTAYLKEVVWTREKAICLRAWHEYCKNEDGKKTYCNLLPRHTCAVFITLTWAENVLYRVKGEG